MTNNTKRDYKIKHTELFGGDVCLQHDSSYQSQRMARCCCCAEVCCCDSAPAPEIKSEGELAGVYFYSIAQQFVLAQQSTFSLPFVEANLKLEKYAGVELYFHEQGQKGKFTRKYRVEADRFLPSGSVTIREEGRVVGQAHLPDVSKGEKQDLDCGNDPDVSYRRDVKVLSQQRESARYEIRLTIQNAKNKPISYKYKETISSAKFTVTPKGEKDDVNKKIESIAQGLKIDGENLSSDQEHVYHYEVLLEYRNPKPCDTYELPEYN